MKTILDAIVDNKRKEVELLKKEFGYQHFEKQAHFSRECISLKKRLTEQEFGVIAEIKRKSPSAGDINIDLNIAKQGKLYAESGVAGISCLTDKKYFGGSIEDLSELRKVVNVPILRKNLSLMKYNCLKRKLLVQTPYFSSLKY